MVSSTEPAGTTTTIIMITARVGLSLGESLFETASPARILGTTYVVPRMGRAEGNGTYEATHILEAAATAKEWSLRVGPASKNGGRRANLFDRHGGPPWRTVEVVVAARTLNLYITNR